MALLLILRDGINIKFPSRTRAGWRRRGEVCGELKANTNSHPGQGPPINAAPWKGPMGRFCYCCSLIPREAVAGSAAGINYAVAGR